MRSRCTESRTTSLRTSRPFGDVADELLAFIDGAELDHSQLAVRRRIHRLRVGSLLNSRRRRIEEACAVVDTLAMARHKHPGQKNSLDALCRRYGVDNSQRELHGALLDAEILADVYLMMTGGQTALFVADEVETSSYRFRRVTSSCDCPTIGRGCASSLRPKTELERHGAVLDDIDRSRTQRQRLAIAGVGARRVIRVRTASEPSRVVLRFRNPFVSSRVTFACGLTTPTISSRMTQAASGSVARRRLVFRIHRPGNSVRIGERIAAADSRRRNALARNRTTRRDLPRPISGQIVFCRGPRRAARSRDMRCSGLRAWLGRVAPSMFYLAGRAQQLIDWERDHRVLRTMRHRDGESPGRSRQAMPRLRSDQLSAAVAEHHRARSAKATRCCWRATRIGRKGMYSTLGGLRRTGRVDRTDGSSRGVRGGRNARQERALSRQPVVAVPEFADARFSRRLRERGNRMSGRRDRGRAMVQLSELPGVPPAPRSRGG